jgi:hypothetical protein
MGFSTTPITVEDAKHLVMSDGEVVSASKEGYFNSMRWLQDVAKAEVADDGITVFFTLLNNDFIEYCCVKSEDRSRF